MRLEETATTNHISWKRENTALEYSDILIHNSRKEKRRRAATVIQPEAHQQAKSTHVYLLPKQRLSALIVHKTCSPPMQKNDNIGGAVENVPRSRFFFHASKSASTNSIVGAFGNSVASMPLDRTRDQPGGASR